MSTFFDLILSQPNCLERAALHRVTYLKAFRGQRYRLRDLLAQEVKGKKVELRESEGKSREDSELKDIDLGYAGHLTCRAGEVFGQYHFQRCGRAFI